MVDRSDETPHGSGARETFLVLLLTLFMGGALVLFLIFATGGFFVYVIGITLALGLFGGCHYLLWGKRFDRQTRVERELMESQEDAELWNKRPTWERRF
jgi:Flp pilus assembly protein TadB